MNLLKEGIEQEAVILTDLKRKLTIDGVTEAYPVYRVKLEYLFYNDQNDRIASWISQYRSEHEGNSPNISDREIYNSIIEEYIIESNPESIKKTQKNIELVEQREPGVVLTDGRIIDGNRRFTCLRNLYKTNPKFGFFETVILDRSIENSAKQIKLMELSIQHGEEEKVDYNPIDKLVGIYHDIVETGLLTPQEYAYSTAESLPSVKRRVEMAKLMVEFLEFINAPRQFHVARLLQIASPLEELATMMKKCMTEDEKEDVKIAVFCNILMQPEEESRKFIRKIKSIIGTEYQDEFLEEQQEIAEKIVDILPPEGRVNATVIREEVRANNDEIRRELAGIMDKSLAKAKKRETRNKPIYLIEKATDLLDSIDMNILDKLNDSEIQRLKRQLNRMEDLMNELREKVL